MGDESIEDDSNAPEEESEDENIISAQEALQAIENAWLNEKFAPEILPHQSELVECMLQQITHIEENVKRLEQGDFRIIIHGMEVERIRYVISSYLRTRLEKIEKYVVHILSEEANRDPEEHYLTPSELRFAKDYLIGVETLFRTLALQHMPTNFQTFEIDKMKVSPNLDSYVYMRANKRVTGIIIPGKMDHEINLEPGSQYFIPYSAIANLVKEGVVQLI